MPYRRLLTIGLLLFALVFVIWPLLLPRTYFNDQLKDAQVRFSTGINHLIGLNECIDLRWSVDHIREVYLDGKGVVGEGIQHWCTNGDWHVAPTLQVHFNKGEIREYTLPTLGWQITSDTIFHFRLLYALMLVLAVGYWGEIPLLSPRIRVMFHSQRIQIMLLALWMVGILFVFCINNSNVLADVISTLKIIQHFLETFFNARYLA